MINKKCNEYTIEEIEAITDMDDMCRLYRNFMSMSYVMQRPFCSKEAYAKFNYKLCLVVDSLYALNGGAYAMFSFKLIRECTDEKVLYEVSDMAHRMYHNDKITKEDKDHFYRLTQLIRI